MTHCDGVLCCSLGSAGARSAVIGLGGGFGAGMSWVECKQTFAVNQAVKPQLSTFNLPALPQPGTAATPPPAATSAAAGARPVKADTTA